MTSFSLRSVGKLAAVLAVALMVGGCGSDDGAASFEDGKVAYDEGNFGKAAELFEDSLKQMPDNVDALVYLALAKTALDDYRAADEVLARAGVLAGDDIDVRLLSAQLAWRLEDYGRARAGYRAIANDTKLDSATRARGWTGLGIVEMSEDKAQLARVAFLQAILLDHRNASACYHLAMLYRNCMPYPAAALNQFDIYVHIDEMASPRVQRVQRQVIPELKKQISIAATSQPNVANRNSTDCSAAMSRAEAAWKKKEYKTALKSYEAALKADPLSYPAALALAKAWLKADTTRAGQQKAFESYLTACKLKPSAISTLLTTGRLATQLGRRGQAVEVYSLAVAMSPKSIEAVDGFIRSLRNAGHSSDVAQAYQAYRDALKSSKRK